MPVGILDQFGEPHGEFDPFAQLLGTGGIAALLLLAAGTGAPAAVDAALTLALLAAFAAVAFANSADDGG